MNTRYLILLLLCGLIAAQCVYYYPLLPARVASHYGVGGQPNGWTTRDGFLGFYFIILSVMAFAMFVLPHLLRYFRVAGINIPNREYWLRSDNREQAYEMLIHEMAWLGNAIFGFLAGVMQLVFEANIAAAGHGRLAEAPFLMLTGIFLAFAIFWAVRLHRRFAIPITPGPGV
jgi:uncharacterized membrane protein